MALRSIMLLDLPRVEYNSKDGSGVKKSDIARLKEQNKILEDERAAGNKKPMTMAEILDKK